MSTQPSPIEQLMVQDPTPAPAPSGNSDTSPIEQLMQAQPSAPPPPKMISQGRDRFGNEIRIPAEDTAGSLVGPLAIPVSAGTIALGAGAIGSALTPAASELIDAAGEPIIQTTKSALKQFAESYPELSKLAAKLGASALGTSGSIGAWELFKHITGRK